MLQSAGHERVKENKFKFLNYRKSIVFLFFSQSFVLSYNECVARISLTLKFPLLLCMQNFFDFKLSDSAT